MIKNLIWDVDGTLFNTYPAFTLAFSKAMIELQAPAPLDKIDRLAKISLGHCARTLAADYSLPVETLEQSFDRHYSQIPAENQGPFPGVRAVCELIASRQGLNLIVTHRQLPSTERLLANHDLSGFFAEIVSAQDGYPIKPDPAMFQMLIEKYQMEPGETLAIGDREIDVQAGGAAGCLTALFGNNPCPTPPDFQFSDYRKLMAFLKKG
jgi:HAD superfamily hydrolase (TIGR01509 family)